MLFSEPHNKWESRINNLLISLNNNAIFPPLITTDIWADLHLSDGSHRHEALLRFGLNKYWPIFYITKIETYNLIVLKKNEK